MQKKAQYKESLEAFDHLILRSPDSPFAILSAREAAKIAYFELKDFKSSIRFYRKIVLSSPDPVERQSAQEQIASIYFNQLTDYDSAIKAINRLLTLVVDKDQRVDYRMKLAKAYYYQNNFSQSDSEATDLLRTEKDNPEVLFQMMVLKANVFMARKSVSKATELLKDVMKKFPERAVKENVATSLAVAFEETKDFKNAIAVLETMKSYQKDTDALDLRIKRLKLAEKNQPGAHGLKHK